MKLINWLTVVATAVATTLGVAAFSAYLVLDVRPERPLAELGVLMGLSVYLLAVLPWWALLAAVFQPRRQAR